MLVKEREEKANKAEKAKKAKKAALAKTIIEKPAAAQAMKRPAAS